jgi:FkbM family methyltransferase
MKGFKRRITAFANIIRTTPEWYLWVAASVYDPGYKTTGKFLYSIFGWMVPKYRGVDGKIYWLVGVRGSSGASYAVDPRGNEFRPVYEVWCDPQRYRLSYFRYFGIQQDDIVVDIGANVGVFSVAAAKRGGRVFAFEPVNETFQRLEQNIAINDSAPVLTAYNVGVSVRGGRRELFVSESSEGFSLFSGSGSGKAVLVNTIPFDEIFTLCAIDHIDFLKVDCEGAEYEIFGAISDASFAKIRKIVLEFHHGKDDLMAKLAQHGFSIEHEISSQAPEMGIMWASRR